MPKTFAIVSNITNGAGLQKDYELMKRMLEGYGHTVYGAMFNAPTAPLRHVDVVIFSEVVDHRWLNYGKQIWLVPNSEWWGDGWNGILPRVNRVLCKTEDCYNIWCRKVGAGRCVYIGWEANDNYLPDVKKEPVFLHLAGKSETKNTAMVTRAWQEHNIEARLIVSAFKPEIKALCHNRRNILQVDRYSEEEAKEVMNRCRFHIMPSKYEGFGMAIHEALGCKGVVLTTNAPPMRDFKGITHACCIPVHRAVPRNTLTQFFEVTPAAIAMQVKNVLALPEEALDKIGETARAGFLAEVEFFRRKFYEVVHAA